MAWVTVLLPAVVTETQPMTRSLAFKLILAFLLVGITGAALTALFARWTTFRSFDRLVLEQGQADFVAEVSAY